jgi:hypothetical protein
MSTSGNQALVIHHYVPSTQKYHIMHTPDPSPPSPARMGATQLPPPQTDNPTTELRRIKPASSTAAAENPKADGTSPGTNPLG